jgi:hypothetical protein
MKTIPYVKLGSVKSNFSIDDYSFSIDINDELNNRFVEFKIEYSEHFMDRVLSRSICIDSITHAILYGDTFYKQGLVFFVLGKNHLSKNIKPQVQKKCRNLIVVMDVNSNLLLTSYRNNDPLIYIRKKSKRRDAFRIVKHQ